MERAVQRAVEVLQAGGVLAHPTDTVYGLGGAALLEVGARQHRCSGLEQKYSDAQACVDEQNRRLSERRNTRPDAAVRRVEKELERRGIDKEVAVMADGRTLSLVWRK